MSEAEPKRASFFRAFLRCGGAITLTEWKALNAEEVASIIDAAGQVEAERAGRIVEALRIQALDEQRGDVLEQAAREAVTGG